MNKQFLSLIAAGLMLGATSQINAMDAGDIRYYACRKMQRRAITSTVDAHDEYSYINTDAGRIIIRPNGSKFKSLEVTYHSWWHSNSPNFCSQHIASYILTSAPLPKVKELETVEQYTERLNIRAQSLLLKYAHMFAPEYNFNPLLLEGPVDPKTQEYSRLRIACAPIQLENGRYKNGINVTVETGSPKSNPWTIRRVARQIDSVLLPAKKDGETPDQYKTRAMNEAISLLVKHASLVPNAKKLTSI